MNEKGANIDLLFRNGLKDYEVLPPQEAWNNIYPSIRNKSSLYLPLRIAAAAVVLITAGILVFKGGKEVSDDNPENYTALNIKNVPSIPGTHSKNHSKTYSVQHNATKKSDAVVRDVVVESRSEKQILSDASASQIYVRDFRKLNISGDVFAKPTLNIKRYGNSAVKTDYYSLPYYLSDNVTNTAKPVSKWSIMAMAAPTYFSNFSSGSDGYTKQLMSTEQPMISYSGGVALSYKVSKKFSVQSGLYYSSLGQRIDGVNAYSGFQKYVTSKGGSNFEVLTSNGVIYASNPDVFLASSGSGKVVTAYTTDNFDPKKENLDAVSNSLNQNFSYLELPVIVRYKILDKAIGINLIGGLTYNFLVNNSVYATIDGSRYSIGETKGLNTHTISSSLGMGMEYNLSGKFSLNLEPTFRYYLNPLNSDAGSYVHSFSFGIFSGISYRF